MISDKKIRNIAAQHKQRGQEIDLYEFARAIYKQGRADQRDSDSALCRDAAEKYLERQKSAETVMTRAAAIASNAAATCLESAIRANIGDITP